MSTDSISAEEMNKALPLIPTGYPCIMVESEQSTFAPLVIQALSAIAATPCGAELLREIVNSKVPAAVKPEGSWKVTIRQANPKANPPRGNASYAFKEDLARERDLGKASAGSRSIVYWDPSNGRTPEGVRPAFIGLAHELIHSHHYANGVAKYSYEKEEDFTVGTENKIRVENNLLPRKSG